MLTAQVGQGGVEGLHVQRRRRYHLGPIGELAFGTSGGIEVEADHFGHLGPQGREEGAGLPSITYEVKPQAYQVYTIQHTAYSMQSALRCML